MKTNMNINKESDEYFKKFFQDFAVAIKTSRLDKALSQDVASEDIGISKNHLAGLEAGSKKPSLKTAIKIINYYNISFDQILRPEALSTLNNLLNIAEMLEKCDANDISIIEATLKAIIKSKELK